MAGMRSAGSDESLTAPGPTINLLPVLAGARVDPIAWPAHRVLGAIGGSAVLATAFQNSCLDSWVAMAGFGWG